MGQMRFRAEWWGVVRPRLWVLGRNLLFQKRSWASLPDVLELQLSSQNPVLPNQVSQGGYWSTESWPGQREKDPKPCLSSLLERRQVWVTELTARTGLTQCHPGRGWKGGTRALSGVTAQLTEDAVLLPHGPVLPVAPHSQPPSASCAPPPHSAPGRESRSHARSSRQPGLKNAMAACSLFVCALKVIFNFGK